MRDDYQIPNLGAGAKQYDPTLLNRIMRSIEMLFETMRSQGPAEFTDITADSVTTDNLSATTTTISGNANITGTLGVTGNTTVGGNLAVAGTSNLQAVTATTVTAGNIPLAWMAPGGRLSFSATDPRPAPAEGATAIYYLPYLHPYVCVPASASTVTIMQIPATGVVNSYSNATTNPAAIPASAVHFGLFLWNNSGVLTLSRNAAQSCNTGGAVAAAAAPVLGPNNLLVNGADITNGPKAKMGLYVGTAFTWSTGISYMRPGGANGGQIFGLANAYNRLTANTQIAYAANSGVSSRPTASLMYVASANSGMYDLQRYTATWGYGGASAVGIYSGTFLRAGILSAAQTPFIDWYTISVPSQSTTLGVTVAGAPNLQPGAWTFYLGASDGTYSSGFTNWGRSNTEFSFEV